MAELSSAYDTSRFGEKVLRIDNVVKRFGDNTVLDHISLDRKSTRLNSSHAT